MSCFKIENISNRNETEKRKREKENNNGPRPSLPDFVGGVCGTPHEPTRSAYSSPPRREPIYCPSTCGNTRRRGSRPNSSCWQNGNGSLGFGKFQCGFFLFHWLFSTFWNLSKFQIRENLIWFEIYSNFLLNSNFVQNQIFLRFKICSRQIFCLDSEFVQNNFLLIFKFKIFTQIEKIKKFVVHTGIWIGSPRKWTKVATSGL
jgi:hypothetical protein